MATETRPNQTDKPTLLYRVAAPFIWPIAADAGQYLALFSIAPEPNLWVIDASARRVVRSVLVTEGVLWSALYELEDAGLTHFLYGDEWAAWLRRFPVASRRLHRSAPQERLG